MKQKLREYMWLVMTVLCVLVGIHQSYKQGIKTGYIFFVFAIFALFFYLVRHNNRMKEK